jgi:phosphate-selective porin OprO/OprP
MKPVRLAGTAVAALCTTLPTLAQARPDDPLAAEQPAAAANWSFDQWRPTVQSADGGFSLSIRARLQFDSALPTRDSSSGAPSLASGAIARRAYLGVEGRAFRELWYEYRMDFGVAAGNADAIINLARIAYQYGDIADSSQPHIRLNVGIIQPLLTHEDGASSNSILFLERADSINIATTVFGGVKPKRGVELTFQHENMIRPGDNFVVSGAVTGWEPRNSQPGSKEPIDRPAELLGRAAYRVWSDGISNLQFGGSAASLLTHAGAITLQDRPEIRVDGHILASTGAIQARGGSLWGLDWEMNLRNFYLSGEYDRFMVQQDTACGAGVACPSGDPEFSGWNIAASWILTGEAKTYLPVAMNKNVATFENPIVNAPFLPGRGWGAWEIAARYSDLDLNWHQGVPGTLCQGGFIGCIRGGEEKIWTLGVNWYLNDNARMLFDYMIIGVDRLGPSGGQIGPALHAIGMRLQFTN